MSWLKLLLALLGLLKKPKPPMPEPEPEPAPLPIVRVQVYDGDPSLDVKVPGAFVTFRRNGGGSISGRAGASGDYEIPLTLGAWTLHVEAEDFRPLTWDVTVPTDGPLLVSLARVPQPEPEPEPIPALPRIVAWGRKFRTEAGQPWRWRGVTGFLLPALIAQSRHAEAEAFVQWAAETGFNLVRVLSMVRWPDVTLTPEQGRAALPATLDLLALYRMYAEVVALADTRAFDMPLDAAREHVRAIGAIADRHSNVALVEIGNELYPLHSTQQDYLRNLGTLRALMATVPDRVLVSLGSTHGREDESLALAGGDVALVHLDRSRDPWNMVRRVRELENVSAKAGVPVIDNEPIGAGEQERKGSRLTDPAIFAAFGLLGRGFGVGSTFHCEAGLRCQVPGSVQQACAQAFIAGATLVPDDVSFRFENARWPNSPVKDARFTERYGEPNTCVRAYSFLGGSMNLLVLLGVTGDPRVELHNGYQAGPVRLVYPGLRVLELVRA